MKDKKLENYEPVKARKKRFYEKYPDGRIVVENVELDADQAVMKAYLYKNKEEQQADLPLSTGYAQEFKGQGGFANKTSWCENCEESAVGRALDNGGFSGNLNCSKEEMIKVENASQVKDFYKLTIGHLNSITANDDRRKSYVRSELTASFGNINWASKDNSYWEKVYNIAKKITNAEITEAIAHEDEVAK